MPRRVTERAQLLPALAEVFREHGYDGASLSLIGEATGLGKGSLYHFFPGGKEEMAAAVLAEIDAWFEAQVFAPLANEERPDEGVEQMFVAVNAYFRSGRRVCLVGAFSLSDARDRFAGPVRSYFARWVDALAANRVRAGWDAASAKALAEEGISGVQGALVLARALDDSGAFARGLATLRERLGDPGPAGAGARTSRVTPAGSRRRCPA